MKVIIVEDNLNNANQLVGVLKKYCPKLELIGIASTVAEAFTLIEQGQPQLLLLDIVLEQQTAFDLLQNLPHRDFEVIFITGYEEYALKAIKFSALDYLLKPIDGIELQAAIKKAEQKLQVQENIQVKIQHLIDLMMNQDKASHTIALPLMKEIRIIAPKEVVYCNSKNSYTNFYLSSGESIMVSRGIFEWDELLEPYGFLRPNQSYLVNRQFIKSLIKEDSVVEILLQDGKRIPVSRLKHEMIKSALMKR